MGWIIFLIFLCILCFIIGWNVLGLILFMVLVLCGIFLGIAFFGTTKQREITKKKREEVQVQKAIKLENKKKEYASLMSELVNKYGEPDKIIKIQEYDINNDIIAFGNAKRIWITGKDLQMSDVLNCTFNDNSHIEKGAVSYETKIKNGSMAKRAIVGGVLTGGAGAVIGGATAKRDTVVNQENDVLIHDYTVIINVNSLSDPVIRIHLGDDEVKTNDILGLMNVIISRR